jgi:uncharacterized membrane protein
MQCSEAATIELQRANAVATAEPGSRQTAWTVALLVALCGLVSALLLPPLRAPDETVHFWRAYDLAQGNLQASERLGEWGATHLPISLVRFDRRCNRLNRVEERVSAKDVPSELRLPLDVDCRQTVSLMMANMYTFVPYIPQAAGIFVARAWGAGPLLLCYAGRLSNLAFAVILAYWAIRVMPFFRLVVGAIILLPITVHQFASLSADASAMGTALLLTALLLRIALDPAFVVRPWIVALLCGLALWLTLCKVPYATILLLYLGIPARRFGGARNYLALGGALVLLVLAGNAYCCFLGNTFVARDHILPGVSVDNQVAFMRANPLHFVSVCGATIARDYWHWLEMLGVLGCLDAPLHYRVLWAYLYVVAALALAEPSPGIVLPFRFRLLGPLAFFLCIGLVLAALYVLWTGVGEPIVQGFQGRYLVPVLPLCLLVAYSHRCRLPVALWLLRTCWLAAAIAVQVGSAMALLNRYYGYVGPRLALFIPFSTAGLIVLVGVWRHLQAWRAETALCGPVSAETTARRSTAA